MSTALRPPQDREVPARGNHIVLFYEEEASLRTSVSEFIANALRAAHPVLVIATAEHQKQFRETLEEGTGAPRRASRLEEQPTTTLSPIDVTSAIRSGRLTMIDAHEVLASIMVNGRPDRDRFNAVIGPLLEQAQQAAARSLDATAAHERTGGSLNSPSNTSSVHAYGEMVDLLWRDGNHEAALALEQLWSDLARRYSFSLFCAYAMRNFASPAEVTGYLRICQAHTHALQERPRTHHDQLRAFIELQPLEPPLPLLPGQVQAVVPPPPKSEAELAHQTSNSFRLLVESVKDYAIFMLDPQGVIATWNAGAERIKGYAAKEIIGRHFSTFYPAADVAAGQCELELEIAARDGRFEAEGWRVRADGTRFWANVIITALYDPSKQLVGFAKVTRDLTERRKADQERFRLLQAQEANRIKDEFLAVVSHELRTPLNAILGWGTILASHLEADAYASKAIATIVRNARAQAHLIEDMLDVSSIIAGKLRLDPRPVDLRTIAGEAVEVVRPMAEAKGVTIDFDTSASPALLVGDPTRLQQIVWNLLSNAVKFTPRGGSVFVRLEEGDTKAKLSVRDTGCGIDPDFLPYVFDRFRQGQAATTGARRTGLGLGLAIVRHLMEMHGGSVEAHSEGTGTGSTFTITLPLESSSRGTRSSTSSQRSVSGRDSDGIEGLIPPSPLTRLDGVSALVIDDDEDARELMSAMLAGRGATVTVARSAERAREQLADVEQLKKIDIIVCDINMDYEDGYDFVRWLRAQPKTQGRDIPALALTAYASATDRRRAFDAGFNNHIPKPVDLEELAVVIRNLTKSRA